MKCVGTWCRAFVAVLCGVATSAAAESYACRSASGQRYISNRIQADCYELLVVAIPKQVARATANVPSKTTRGVRNPLAKASPYAGLFAQAALDNGVDPYLLAAVASVESNFDARAVSPKGAIGLMQIMPQLVMPGLAGALFDPAVNIRTGARHLSALMRRYPDNLMLVLAAYNAGEGAVARYGNNVPPFDETRAYVVRVLERYREFNAIGRRGESLSAR